MASGLINGLISIN